MQLFMDKTINDIEILLIVSRKGYVSKPFSLMFFFQKFHFFAESNDLIMVVPLALTFWQLLILSTCLAN